jgi:hypothetical protein
LFKDEFTDLCRQEARKLERARAAILLFVSTKEEETVNEREKEKEQIGKETVNFK